MLLTTQSSLVHGGNLAAAAIRSGTVASGRTALIHINVRRRRGDIIFKKLNM
ncbi:MAG: hypothetical protein WCG92_09790 [Hyphomicrobiales bacterium]